MSKILDSITSVQDAIEIGTYFTQNWFRGHSIRYNELKPRIFRKPFSGEDVIPYVPKTEFAVIEKFQRLAPSVSGALPDYDAMLDWLIIMQHYGCPTRLLDWTQNILVALFFAVNSDKHSEEDGELWTIYPTRLNEQSGIYGFPLKNHPVLRYLYSVPFHNEPEKLAENFELTAIPELPVAFFPTLNFPRITYQLGTFTIHNSPADSEKLKNQLTDKSDLFCFCIPHSSKEKIFKDLQVLGINHRTMFQNLDALSKDIVNEYKNPLWELWGQPDFGNLERLFSHKDH